MDKNKLINLTLSLFAAILAWLVIFNISDSVVSVNRTIDINVKNEQSLLNKKLDYSLRTTKAQITFKARSQDIGTIRDSDFNAYVDLEQLTSNNIAQVYVDILNDKENAITDLKVEPSIIHIDTEEIQSKQIEIDIIYDGEPKNNFSISNVALDNNSVSLEGPASEVGRVSTAEININTAGIESDMSGTADITFRDSSGNTVEFSDKTSSNISSVSYNVEVALEKEVELTATIAGTPDEGVIYTSYDILPSKIRVIGRPDVINPIETLSLGVFDITGRTEKYTEEINIEDRLPDGVMLASTQARITVEINLAKIDLSTASPSVSDNVVIEPVNEGDTTSIGPVDETEVETETDLTVEESTEYGPGV